MAVIGFILGCYHTYFQSKRCCPILLFTRRATHLLCPSLLPRENRHVRLAASLQPRENRHVCLGASLLPRENQRAAYLGIRSHHVGPLWHHSCLGNTYVRVIWGLDGALRVAWVVIPAWEILTCRVFGALVGSCGSPGGSLLLTKNTPLRYLGGYAGTLDPRCDHTSGCVVVALIPPACRDYTFCRRLR